MWILVMILYSSAGGSSISHTYFEDERVCKAAAVEFESHKTKDYKLKSFCVSGDK